MSRAVIVLLSFAALLVCAAVEVSGSTVKFQDGIVNRNVKRRIELTTNAEEVTLDITFSNTGSSPVTEYFYAIHPDRAANFSYIRATTSQATFSPSAAQVTGTAALEGTLFFRIPVPAVAPGATTSINVLTLFTHTLHPYPTQITEHESQLVRYFDNHFVYSAYASDEQTTTVNLASDKIEGRSHGEKPSKVSGNDVIYGPYKQVKPFSVSKMHVHYENNYPFVTFTKLTKEVEVSQWGNVAIEEHYNLKHSGAALTGPFSRVDLQRGRVGKAAFRTLTAKLPKAASAVYYRDVIGNVSTSHLRVAKDHQQLDIDPRFPMFGGWKTDFLIGYSLPAAKTISVSLDDADLHVLNLTFSTSFTIGVIDRMVMRVVLPEGATDIKYQAPFDIEDVSFDTRFTYLDTIGRPVLVLKKSNLCKYHNQYFQVSYRFKQSTILREPLMLSLGFFVFFLSAMFYMRLHLSISPASREGIAENSGRLGEICNDMLDALAQVERALAKGEVDGLDSISSLLAEIKKFDSRKINAVTKATGLVVSIRTNKGSKDKALENVRELRQVIPQLSA